MMAGVRPLKQPGCCIRHQLKLPDQPQLHKVHYRNPISRLPVHGQLWSSCPDPETIIAVLQAKAGGKCFSHQGHLHFQRQLNPGTAPMRQGQQLNPRQATCRLPGSGNHFSRDSSLSGCRLYYSSPGIILFTACQHWSWACSAVPSSDVTEKWELGIISVLMTSCSRSPPHCS